VKALLALAKGLFASIWTMSRDDLVTILHTGPHAKKNENKIKKRKEVEGEKAFLSIVEEVIGLPAQPPEKYIHAISGVSIPARFEDSGSLLHEKKTLCPFL